MGRVRKAKQAEEKDRHESGRCSVRKMGLIMVERLLEEGHRAVAFDRDRKSAEDIAKKERSLPIL